MGKPKPRERDLFVGRTEIEGLSLECHECGARAEITHDGELREDAACPQCGEPIGRREMARLFRDFLRSMGTEREVRIRVRLLKRLPL